MAIHGLLSIHGMDFPFRPIMSAGLAAPKEFLGRRKYPLNAELQVGQKVAVNEAFVFFLTNFDLVSE